MNFVIADPTEARNLPKDLLEVTTFHAGLEALCGADFVVSPSKLPVNASTIRIHINKGVSVQRKAAPDFIASFQSNDTRLWRQLVRLRLVCPQPWLLIVGHIGSRLEDREDSKSPRYASVDGKATTVLSSAVTGAKRYWQLRGGYYDDIPTEDLLLSWCQSWYEKLCKVEKQGGWGTTLIKREVAQPLELLSAIETSLCTLPGLGSERAHSLYLETLKYIDKPNFLDCVRILRDNKVEGIGTKTRESVLKFVGFSTIK